jgi:LPXTG-motif cell wall-anchored protein
MLNKKKVAFLITFVIFMLNFNYIFAKNTFEVNSGDISIQAYNLKLFETNSGIYESCLLTGSNGYLTTKNNENMTFDGIPYKYTEIKNFNGNTNLSNDSIFTANLSEDKQSFSWGSTKNISIIYLVTDDNITQYTIYQYTKSQDRAVRHYGIKKGLNFKLVTESQGSDDIIDLSSFKGANKEIKKIIVAYPEVDFKELQTNDLNTTSNLKTNSPNNITMTPTAVNKVTPTASKNDVLPKTGEKNNNFNIIMGLLIIVITFCITLYKKIIIKS